MTTTWYIVVMDKKRLVLHSTGPCPSLEAAIAKTTAFRDAEGALLRDKGVMPCSERSKTG